MTLHNGETVDLIATLTARPGAGPALFEAMESVLEAVRREDGCIRYDLYADRDNPLVAVMLETWRDQAALDAHNRGAALGALLPRLEPLLAAPLGLQFLTLRA
jgi:quinol monooxygenase YgiN